MGNTSKVTKKDELFRLKFIGYCTAFLPPEGAKVEYSNFLTYAKFQICQVRNILMNDPIWNNYSDEELLVEYFAITYANSTSEKEKFEGLLAGEAPDLLDWFDNMIAKNKKDLENIKNAHEEEIGFKPSDIMDGE